jgi:hypothetical protein
MSELLRDATTAADLAARIRAEGRGLVRRRRARPAHHLALAKCADPRLRSVITIPIAVPDAFPIAVPDADPIPVPSHSRRDGGAMHV